MRIVVELKRDANAQVVLNQLYSYTQLQDTVGVIMLALQDGQPKVMTLKEILTHYIDFQEEVITRRTRYDLRKAKDREHILEGMKLVVDQHRRGDPDHPPFGRPGRMPRSNLLERFGVTDEQASAIVAMRLGQLSGMERIKIEEELAEILSEGGRTGEHPRPMSRSSRPSSRTRCRLSARSMPIPAAPRCRL